MNYIIFIILTTLIVFTTGNFTYNVKIWNAVQCPDKGIISYRKLPRGHSCSTKALLNNHFFFFDITFEGVNNTQLCYFCDGIINPKYYKGKCRDGTAIWYSCQISYSKLHKNDINIKKY